jgi:hypothetical protein
MPWFKCSHCRIRRSGLDVAISAAQDTCPLCGRTLDVERDLTSLVGFRFLTNDALSTKAGSDRSLRAPAAVTTDADAASDALAADRWLDEGGSSEPGRRSR